jgi:hypothetical protein
MAEEAATVKVAKEAAAKTSVEEAMIAMVAADTVVVAGPDGSGSGGPDAV